MAKDLGDFLRVCRVQDQDAALRERIGEITAIGSEFDRAPARAGGARARVEELGQRKKRPGKQVAKRDRFFRESREGCGATYEDESLEGLVAVPGGWFGSGEGVVGDPRCPTCS